MKVGSRNFEKLKRLFEKHGLPELLAFMAAKNADVMPKSTLFMLLETFTWGSSPEGHDFWSAVNETFVYQYLAQRCLNKEKC